MTISRKRVYSIIAAFILMLVFLFPIQAHAAVMDSGYKEAYMRPSYETRAFDITINTHGLNQKHHTDVIMYDANGKKVWEEYGAIGTNQSRTFRCGSNMYTIKVRVGSKDITGWLASMRGNFTTSVTYR